MLVLVNHSTDLNVRFHLGCISPHVLLYHVNHMMVQMMSIAVEDVVLVPELWMMRLDPYAFVQYLCLNHADC